MREQKDRYEIFLKVCETGSFSKAAKALNYTQSGISQMMAALEEELGVTISQELVMAAFSRPGLVSRPLSPPAAAPLAWPFPKPPALLYPKCRCPFCRNRKNKKMPPVNPLSWELHRRLSCFIYLWYLLPA